MRITLDYKGRARMRRVDMWDWCLSNKPTGKKLKSLQKWAKDYDSYAKGFVAALAIINSGNLIIGLYDAKTGNVFGCYYMTPSGNHIFSKDGKNWGQDKLRYIPIGGYSFYASADGFRWKWLSGTDKDADEWIESNEKLSDGWYQSQNTERKIDGIENNLTHMRTRSAGQRRIDKITAYVDGMMVPPEGIDEGWINGTVFGGRHYAFMVPDSKAGKKSDKKRDFVCTACRGTVETEWKHNKTEICPVCQAAVRVSKTQIAREEYERVSYFYRAVDMKGNACLAMVTANVRKRWNGLGEEISFSSPRRVLTSPIDWRWGNWGRETAIYYNHGGDWSDRNSYGFQTSAGFLYLPRPDVIQDTFYEDMLRPVKAAAERGWRLNYDHFLMKDGSICGNVFEMLVKGGFEKLTGELIRGAYYYDVNRPKWDGKNADEVLGVNGQSRARLRKLNGGLRMIAWLWSAEVCGYKLTDEELVWLSHSITPEDLGQLQQNKHLPKMGISKIINYIRKQIKAGGIYRNYYRSTAQSAIAVWLDYLDMAKTLGLDLSRDSVYKPKNLKERHDELAGIISMKKREEQAKADAARLRKQAKAMEEKYPGVAPVCAKIKELYEWTGDGYSVVVPSGAWDIMQEGVLLGHCSSREDENVYLERVEQETSYIMFLRKNDRKDSPWYTMEVEPGGNVIQLRTYGDDDGKHMYHDRDEAKAALHLWRKDIAKRLGQGELSKAQKSREMLLKYWDGLQKNGNIIRGGYLKGSLLVDVLQADYKELNGELPEEEVG